MPAYPFCAAGQGAQISTNDSHRSCWDDADDVEESSCATSTVCSLGDRSALHGDDYHHHLRQLEVDNPAPVVYMRSSCCDPSLNPETRASLVNWMCSTAHALYVCPEALFLGVSLLDRYLSHACTTATSTTTTTCTTTTTTTTTTTSSSSSSGSDGGPLHLGIAACACLSIAAKVESAASPPLRAYLHFLAPELTLARLCQGEQHVLAALDYRVTGVPTTIAALSAIFHRIPGAAAGPQGPAAASLLHAASYLAELSLLEYHLLPVAPSLLAAACFGYALLLHGWQMDGQQLHRLTGYSQGQLVDTMGWLCAVRATVGQAAANGRPYAATRWYQHRSAEAAGGAP